MSVRRSVGFALAAALLSPAGCSESIQEYTKLGGWSRSPSNPVVLSGSPQRDSSAYGASGDVLTEHDWKVLEKIAPRPIWERLAEARAMLEARSSAGRPTTSPRPDPVGDAMKLALDVPATTLPDGQVQMYYQFRHYGGVVVASATDAGTERRKVTVQPSDLAPLVAVVTAQLAGKGTVVPLPDENTLVITCAPEVKQSVLTLLAGIDVPPKQVEINARIFEVAHDFDFQVGAKTLVQRLSGDSEQSLLGTFDTTAFLEAIGSAGGFQGGVLRLLQVFENAGVKLELTLQLLADTGLVKVVASPRMTVTAGRTAYMLAGQELPIQSARFQADQILTEKTTYKPVGVQLYITPQVVGPENVKLHVVTMVSAVSGFTPLAGMSQQEQAQPLINPVLDSREAETFVTVPNDSTLVIGGLRMIRTITRERKIPGLGDVPLLEWLFKSHRSQNHVNDLYFFVTPQVIATGRPHPQAEPVSLRRPVPPPAPARSPAPAPQAAPPAEPQTASAPAEPPP